MDNVFYHGSNYEISKFSDDFIGIDGAILAEGPGIYFTNSKENAEMWGKYTHTVILRPRKVITNLKPANRVNRADLKKFLDMSLDYIVNRVDNVEKDKMLAIEDAIKYSRTEDEVFHSLRQEQYVGAHKRFMKDMSSLGYDAAKLYKKGFKFNDVDKVYHYVVYNPEIVEIVKVERNKNVEEVRKLVKKIIKERYATK
jgi:hypothetical protein